MHWMLSTVRLIYPLDRLSFVSWKCVLRFEFFGLEYFYMHSAAYWVGRWMSGYQVIPLIQLRF